MQDAASPAAGVPAPLGEFVALYAAGRFWDSHEALEGAWRETGSDFYQGLILYASAWVHWQRGNAHGVRAQLRKALQRLEDQPAAYLGIDVSSLRSHCRACIDALHGEAVGWEARIAPAPLELREHRIRGDEPEAQG